jgi:hypothetical protein
MKYPLLASLIASLGICLVGAAHAADFSLNAGTHSPVLAAQAPVATGWHGDRYYDGHRYWERREWEAHKRHHEDRGHCPPGHMKKGEC